MAKLSEKIKEINTKGLEVEARDLEETIKALFKRCILDTKNILMKKKRIYAKLQFKEVISGFELHPELELYDRKNKSYIGKIFFCGDRVFLNKDYNGNLSKKEIGSISESLKDIDYKIIKEPSYGRKGGAGGGCGG